VPNSRFLWLLIAIMVLSVASLDCFENIRNLGLSNVGCGFEYSTNHFILNISIEDFLMIKCVGVRWQLFSDQQWFVSPRATSLSSGLFIVNGGKGLEQITIVLYLKLIKATYVQVCWQFGDNFSEISSFLSSSQILERLAFYWKRRRRAAAVYVCDLFEILQSYSC